MQSTEEWQIANENNKSKLTSYWENRYATGGNSGAGSYGDEALLKASIINYWIAENGIKTVAELGSGDANNLQFYRIPISYVGYDISKTAVDIANEKTRRVKGSLKYYFTNKYNDQDFDADLMLCLDVWYYLVEEADFQAVCKNLFEDFRGKYIIIYSTDTNSQFTEDGQPLAKHVKYREVLSKIAEYPQFKVKYWIDGFIDTDNNNYKFPTQKKMFLLERI